MGFSGISRIADAAEKVTGLHRLPNFHCNGPWRHMSQDDDVVFAIEQNMIARHMLSIRLRNRHVGQSIRSADDYSSAWSKNAGAINHIGLWVARRDTVRMKSKTVGADQINGVALPSKWKKSLASQSHQMRIHGLCATAVDHYVSPRLQGHCEGDCLRWGRAPINDWSKPCHGECNSCRAHQGFAPDDPCQAMSLTPLSEFPIREETAAHMQDEKAVWRPDGRK